VGKYLDLLKRANAQSDTRDISDQSDKSPPFGEQNGDFGRFSRFGRRPLPYCHAAIHALERRCPAYVEHARWRQAIGDARRFLSEWGNRAEALGWTARDLLGLHQVPEQPRPNYDRLSRYDETGLIWLLGGRPVVALTAETASIQHASGAITVYRKNKKPAFGPLGDSLGHLESVGAK
jgi:hypothetical protein